MKKIFICTNLLLLSLVTFMTACVRQHDTSTETSNIQSNEENDMNQFKIKVDNRAMIATFADNAATNQLKEILKEKDLSISMHDYGNFEKVGPFGFDLPTSDTKTTTTIGDIMLYNGNQMVIFYESNQWSYTRLGKIENATRENLLNFLGTGEVTITLSLVKE